MQRRLFFWMNKISILKMVYVVTGGPGFGKSTVIDLLEKQGFPVCQEGARSILSAETTPILTSRERAMPLDFERTIADWRLNFLLSIQSETIAFSDRGLPDQIAYSWYKKKNPSDFIEGLVDKHRYASVVFVTPPWKAIYGMDDIRQEHFSEASKIHDYILAAYLKYGYKIVNLPLVNPDERVRFILNFLYI
jgi:predicted ATPase